jgi:MYXO-CTERM domain-containing protein
MQKGCRQIRPSGRDTQVGGFHPTGRGTAPFSWVLVQFRRCAAKKLVAIRGDCCILFHVVRPKWKSRIMNNRKRSSVRSLVLVVACLVSVAWADDTLVLQNTGAGAAMGGVYTSPYGITVNGTPTLLICDDFETDISLGHSWFATPNTLTQISSTTVNGLKFASSPYSSAILAGSSAAEDYATAAVLAAELLALPHVGTSLENTESAGELSYAIWSVFDNSLYTSLNSTGSTGFGSLSAGEVAAVDADILLAQALVNAATVGGVTTLDNISINGQPITNLTVYSPNPLGASQEFLTVNTPEPSGSVMAALAGLAAFVAARRRRARNN